MVVYFVVVVVVDFPNNTLGGTEEDVAKSKDDCEIIADVVVHFVYVYMVSSWAIREEVSAGNKLDDDHTASAGADMYEDFDSLEECFGVMTGIVVYFVDVEMVELVRS